MLVLQLCPSISVCLRHSTWGQDGQPRPSLGKPQSETRLLISGIGHQLTVLRAVETTCDISASAVHQCSPVPQLQGRTHLFEVTLNAQHAYERHNAKVNQPATLCSDS